MNPRTKTDTIVIHCAATKPSMNIGAEEIKKWHVDERGWSDIGYHFVITRDGTKELGRGLDLSGAHARAVNGTSVGICLVGGLSEDNKPENNFTLEQFLTLKDLIKELKMKYPDAKKIIGHYQVEPAKPHCPGFNVPEWLNKESL
jgi:N-acetyl-anhydromuramyl-L-alanine amidase AmpD